VTQLQVAAGRVEERRDPAVLAPVTTGVATFRSAPDCVRYTSTFGLIVDMLRTRKATLLPGEPNASATSTADAAPGTPVVTYVKSVAPDSP
jgi:hypothetical protein